MEQEREKTNVTPEETQLAVISKRAEQKGRRQIAKKVAEQAA